MRNWLRKKIRNWLGIEQSNIDNLSWKTRREVGFIKAEARRQIYLNSIKRIKKEISVKTGVSIKELESPSRKQHIVRARNIAMKRCREMGATLEMIGSAFNRHHSTVIHSIT